MVVRDYDFHTRYSVVEAAARRVLISGDRR
jgi:Arc/MetJ family transcription regulator